MKAYLSLGSNLGDRLEQLQKAIQQLEEHSKITVINTSGVYETIPWGGVKQEDFLNQVIEIETDLSPQELLTTCQDIECFMGRERLVHWGPRIIDIDILIYEDLIIEEDNLIIPHPYLEQREFVLIPLQEIAPQLLLPSGKRIAEIQSTADIKKYNV